ncbi:MAG TPA: hypothetical protein EYO78_11510 [Gammaproteobacteria bacterium]|nr:hypothetical protein [Gammaproteobacteria bacterium]
MTAQVACRQRLLERYFPAISLETRPYLVRELAIGLAELQRDFAVAHRLIEVSICSECDCQQVCEDWIMRTRSVQTLGESDCLRYIAYRMSLRRGK